MEEIRALDVEDDTYVAKTTVLIENVEHHAKEEEEELFPSVRSATDAASLDELAGRLELGKQELGAPALFRCGGP